MCSSLGWKLTYDSIEREAAASRSRGPLVGKKAFSVAPAAVFDTLQRAHASHGSPRGPRNRRAAPQSSEKNHVHHLQALTPRPRAGRGDAAAATRHRDAAAATTERRSDAAAATRRRRGRNTVRRGTPRPRRANCPRRATASNRPRPQQVDRGLGPRAHVRVVRGGRPDAPELARPAADGVLVLAALDALQTARGDGGAGHLDGQERRALPAARRVARARRHVRERDGAHQGLAPARRRSRRLRGARGAAATPRCGSRRRRFRCG